MDTGQNYILTWGALFMDSSRKYIWTGGTIHCIIALSLWTKGLVAWVKARCYILKLEPLSSDRPIPLLTYWTTEPWINPISFPPSDPHGAAAWVVQAARLRNLIWFLAIQLTHSPIDLPNHWPTDQSALFPSPFDPHGDAAWVVQAARSRNLIPFLAIQLTHSPIDLPNHWPTDQSTLFPTPSNPQGAAAWVEASCQIQKLDPTSF